MAPNLVTVAALAKDPANPFTEAQLRWFIFNAATNGLDRLDAIRRVGRRVYIDVPTFHKWLGTPDDEARASSYVRDVNSKSTNARESFAGLAMQTILADALANDPNPFDGMDSIAWQATQMADALIHQLARPRGSK